MANILTVCIPNRNRLGDNNSTKFLFKSLGWQTNKNFDFIIVDGGSSNLDVWSPIAKSYFPAITIISHKLGEEFNKPLLNNIGIRSAKTPFIMTTDADIMFAPQFMETAIQNMASGTLLESRTMYWKDYIANKIYSGELDLEKDVASCRHGRIKKRTTCGGCQCMHIDDWTKIRGYDETFIGWGSEDQDLLKRADMAKMKIKWLGESNDGIMLFHQPHSKDSSTIQKEMKHQERNKNALNNVLSPIVNLKGWGNGA